MMHLIKLAHAKAASPSRRSTRSSARRMATPRAPCSAPPTWSASTPSSTSPTTATTTLHQRRGARRLQGARRTRADGREEAARRQDRRRLLQEDAGDGHRHARPQDARVPPAAEGQVRRRWARPRASTTPRERIRTVLAGDDRAARARAQRVTCATLAYASPPPRRDRRRRRQHRPRACAGASAGTSARSRPGTRSACRRASTRWRSSASTPAPWVEEMLARGPRRASTTRRTTYWDVATKTATPVPSSPRDALAADVPQARDGVVFENDGATLCDLGDGIALPRVPDQDERHRRRRHHA